MRKLILTCAVAVSCSAAFAAEVTYLGESIEGRPVVLILGDFEKADIEKFANVTRGLEAAVVLFESAGGDLEAGLEIGTRIRLRGFSSVVANGKQCLSACALAWLGGETRFSGVGAEVSFHAAYIIEDGTAQESGYGNALVGAYAANLGLQRDMILFLTTAGPAELNVLTPEWAGRLGLTVTFGDTNWTQIASATVVLPDGFQDGLTAFNTGDYGTALEKWRPYAEQGKAAAQRNLGQLYLFGKGVPQDFAKAMYWYKLAADQGDAVAQFNVGLMYDLGQGIPQNFAEALYWYKLAAEQGDAEAQFSVGEMYLLGEGSSQDAAEAVKWYRLAAEQGSAKAQHSLGNRYKDGKGVPQDFAEAVKWYRLAAEQGYALSQYDLALRYTKGEGVPQDFVTAHMWSNIAAGNGHEQAGELREFLTDRMSLANISDAQARARRCMASAYADCD